MEEMVRVGSDDTFIGCCKLPLPNPLEEVMVEALTQYIVLPGPPLAVHVNVMLPPLSTVALAGLTRMLPKGDTTRAE